MDSPTSRCLANGDILFCILTELYHPIHRRRAGLAALAATSHAMFEAVIPVLWQMLNSPRPLMWLLEPTDLWYQKPSDQAYWTSLRPNLDWTRFDMYACHVRRLEHNCDDLLVAIEDWDCLSLIMRPNRLLLPRLRSLIVEENWPDRLSQWPLWFSPSITDLRLTWCTDLCLPEMLPENLHEKCPQLEELHLAPRLPVGGHLYLDYVENTIQNILTGCITGTGMPSLRRFNCKFPLSMATFKAFAALTHLQTLAVSVGPKALKDITCNMRNHQDWLPALVSLSLTVANVSEDLLTLVTAFHSELKCLSLQIILHPSTSDLRLLTKTVARSAYAKGLTDLSIGFHCDPLLLKKRRYLDEHPPVVDVGEALEPLFGRQSLTELSVRGGAMRVTEGDLGRIAEAYPLLRKLVILGRERTPRDDGCTSARSLLITALKFPRLEEVELRYCGGESDIPSPAELDRLLPSPSSQIVTIYINICLSVECSLTNTFDGALAFVAYIQRVYPHARLIIRHEPSKPAWGHVFPEPWEQVYRHLKAQGGMGNIIMLY